MASNLGFFSDLRAWGCSPGETGVIRSRAFVWSFGNCRAYSVHAGFYHGATRNGDVIPHALLADSLVVVDGD